MLALYVVITVRGGGLGHFLIYFLADLTTALNNNGSSEQMKKILCTKKNRMSAF